MSNMSYCRFENTFRDLGDCETALECLIKGYEDPDGEQLTPLSDSEKRFAIRLIDTAFDIVNMVAESAGVRNLEDLTDTDIIDVIETAQAAARAEETARIEAEERERMAAAEDRVERERDR